MKLALSIFFGVFSLLTHGELNLQQYQVALIVDGTKFCCGAVYDEEFVITVTSCVKGATEVDVVFGDSSVWSLNVTASIATTIIIGYGREDVLKQIALLRLPRRVVFGNGINRFTIPRTTYRGTKAILTGWTADGRIRRTLQVLDTTRISLDMCGNSLIGEVEYCSYADNDDQIGDLGSPLFTSNGELLGLMLAKIGTSIHFTAIEEHYDWLISVTGKYPK